MIAEMYSPYTLDFVVKECRVEARIVEKLYDMLSTQGREWLPTSGELDLLDIEVVG